MVDPSGRKIECFLGVGDPVGAWVTSIWPLETVPQTIAAAAVAEVLSVAKLIGLAASDNIAL